ncbi:thiamine-phosphate kinase [Halomonas sabkhae]|uniref:thiamine-phosphate kinase n=1 Tax=Halomonas sabkhae TaxID=626223 RepID=UPI0025B48640|nr:thiamine-phosphate kinase [Halomonas sabkhae]MDN3524175.1 thiamine-phosphate kinase [Halomonas sabkhae]
MHSEFELISRFLTPASRSTEAGVALGIGDDAALLTPAPGQRLAVSVDTSVADVHFPASAPARAIGHRALAVSLSDLAAMGARARWCLMSLTLPEPDGDWVAAFAEGFHALCRDTGVELAGGDVSRGELAVGVTVMGEVPPGEALTRTGAEPGHYLAVTGVLGGGAGGLAHWQAGERDLSTPLLGRYLLPEPRLSAGMALRGLASAAIDISDGLLADLGHLCQASGLGARLCPDSFPLAVGLVDRLGTDSALQAALSGGDDYELLVSLSPDSLEPARQRLAALEVPLTVIGSFTSEPGLQGVDASTPSGWQHFPGERP